VTVGLGQSSLSSSAASRLKTWEITTINSIVVLLTRWLMLEHKLPLRDSSAACTPHSPGLTHYLHVPGSPCVLTSWWEGLHAQQKMKRLSVSKILWNRGVYS
jgi:hypothetical protein